MPNFSLLFHPVCCFYRIMTSCFKCNELIAASPMVCAGYCGLSFHRECTGVSDGSLNELDVGSGLLWMCSGCIEVRNSGKIGLVAELEALLRKVLNGVETSLMAAISSLREEILSQFENKQTRPLYADVTMARPASHPLITHSVTRASQDHSHSDMLLNIPRTPAATLPLLQNGFDKRTCDDPPMLPAHTPRIWLFLSRFAPTVTEDHVTTMVATRLSLLSRFPARNPLVRSRTLILWIPPLRHQQRPLRVLSLLPLALPRPWPPRAAYLGGNSCELRRRAWRPLRRGLEETTLGLKPAKFHLLPIRSLNSCRMYAYTDPRVFVYRAPFLVS